VRRWTPRAAPVRNSRHRGHPAPRRADYNVVIRSGSEAVQPAATRTLTAMGRALVLNATELPLAVVPARRAVVLVLKEKAEVVQSNGAIFHSERIALEAPSVVRLRHFVHVPFRAHAPLTRRAVFARDGWECQYCGSAAENLDHVLPRSRGGHTTWNNVVAACSPCNLRKGNLTPNEAKMWPSQMPFQPTVHHLHRNGRLFPPNYLHDSWLDYLYWDTELEP